MFRLKDKTTNDMLGSNSLELQIKANQFLLVYSHTLAPKKNINQMTCKFCPDITNVEPNSSPPSGLSRLLQAH